MDSINNLINSGVNVSFTITGEDLKIFGDYLINKTRLELERQIKSQNEEIYLTKEETAKKLNVTLATLWNWNKKGHLKHVEAGGRRLYRSSDVKEILESRQNS